MDGFLNGYSWWKVAGVAGIILVLLTGSVGYYMYSADEVEVVTNIDVEEDLAGMPVWPETEEEDNVKVIKPPVVDKVEVIIPLPPKKPIVKKAKPKKKVRKKRKVRRKTRKKYRTSCGDVHIFFCGRDHHKYLFGTQ